MSESNKPNKPLTIVDIIGGLIILVGIGFGVMSWWSGDFTKQLILEVDHLPVRDVVTSFWLNTNAQVIMCGAAATAIRIRTWASNLQSTGPEASS